MAALFGSVNTPALWDTRTGELLQGEEAINRYLDSMYGLAAMGRAA